MSKIIHMMVRVLELDRSIQFYQKAFDLQISKRLDFSDFSLVYLRNADNDFEVELTWNRERTEPYDLGDGYGHFAVCVDDLEAEHKRFTEEGLQPRDMVSFAPDGELIARFFFVADPDGYQIEVLQRHGHYQ